MNQEYSHLLKKIAHITGCISSKEAIFLYEKAKNCKNGVIVELGTWRGKSAICLGLGSKNGYGAKVYAVDPHTGSPDQRTYGIINTYEEFKKNIKDAGLEDIIEPVVMTSFEAVKSWNKPIGLIFVDSNYYDYELTKKDFLDWSHFLTKNGVYALHNTVPTVSGILEGVPLHGWKDTRKFMQDFIFPSNNYKNLKIYGTITTIEKAENNSSLDKIKNKGTRLKSALIYLNHDIYMALTNIPQPIKKLAKIFLSPKQR